MQNVDARLHIWPGGTPLTPHRQVSSLATTGSTGASARPWRAGNATEPSPAIGGKCGLFYRTDIARITRP